MIGRLKGIIDAIDDDYIILDVHGVGYQVFISTRTRERLPPLGQAATLEIETYVREDMIRLYGFNGASEREWFRLLMTVQGVGARVALGVLSVLDPPTLTTAIASRDFGMIARAPGVGKRLAERIATELKEKAPAFIASGSHSMEIAQDFPHKNRSLPKGEAVSALINLGYPEARAAAAIAQAVQALGEEAALEALIRFGLKELAR